MIISVLSTYVVRYDVQTDKGECFGGRAKVKVWAFTQIPQALATMRGCDVGDVNVESAVLIERKEFIDHSEASTGRS